MKTLSLFSLLLFTNTFIFSQFGSQDTGGPLLPEQAAYDVQYYNINLDINPGKKSIAGWVGVRARVNNSISFFVLNLDDRYDITSIKLHSDNNETYVLPFQHNNGKVIIELPYEFNPGEMIDIEIHYSGIPRIAERPPWDDGFTWTQTESGEDWIGVTCQGGGADIWWPCKDHPSDEPDSASLSFTVPGNLFCASNGKLLNTIDNIDGTKTYEWFVSTPINNYGVSVHIAPYDTIQYNYTSITGETIPVTIWVLPESMDKACPHCPKYLDHLKFYEKYLGPYPFRIDKYGVAETSYLGMEHQTIIANGYGYKSERWGFDWLHHHELGHEWWGNMVTAKDWSDFWIHEAICGYMQALYLEETNGIEAYHKFFTNFKEWKNEQPIAPRKEMTGTEAYTYDMYSKGGSVLHTLRYYLGKETFLRVLRRWSYPDPEMEKIKDGAQCRFVTTDEFLQIAEEVSDKKLDWFWEVYFRQASLPKLNAVIKDNVLNLEWQTENNIPFYVPVEVKIDDETVKVEMKEGAGSIKIPGGVEPEIDPDKWLTMDSFEITNK